jgi:DNA-binding response OmpR family regulator
MTQPLAPQSLVVFVIEENAALRQSICEALVRDGHLCLGLACAEAVDDAVLRQAPDVFLIGLNSAAEQGLGLARRLRSSQPEVGIVVLAADTGIDDRLRGYAQGIDLYLPQSMHSKELAAVVGAMARRLKVQAREMSMDLRVQMAKLMLLGPKGARPLTNSELRLIEALARAPGQTLESWQVAAHLAQSKNVPSKASVEVRLSRIRRKLHDVGSQTSAIKAIKGYGYKLNVPITLMPH